MYPFTEALNSLMRLPSPDENSLAHLYICIFTEIHKKGPYIADAVNAFTTLDTFYKMPQRSIEVAKTFFPPSSHVYKELAKKYTDFCLPTDVLFCKTEEDVSTLKFICNIDTSKQIIRDLINNNVDNKNLANILLQCLKDSLQDAVDAVWECLDQISHYHVNLHNCIRQLHSHALSCNVDINLPQDWCKIDRSINGINDYKEGGVEYLNSLLFRAHKFSNDTIFIDKDHLCNLITKHGFNIETLDYIKKIAKKTNYYSLANRKKLDSFTIVFERHLEAFLTVDKDFLDCCIAFSMVPELIVKQQLPFSQRHMSYFLSLLSIWIHTNDTRKFTYVLNHGTVSSDWWREIMQYTTRKTMKLTARSIEACLPLSESLHYAIDDVLYTKKIKLARGFNKELSLLITKYKEGIREHLHGVPQLYKDVINVIVEY